MVYYMYFCHCMSLHVCPGDCVFLYIYILGSLSANKLKTNCPFGILLVVFSVRCLFLNWVLLSLWCLGRSVLGNCTDS